MSRFLRRFFSLLVIASILSSLVSCSYECSAYSVLSEFKALYGAEGTVYAFGLPEGDDGYLELELYEKIYDTKGAVSREFAIFLNPRPELGPECAIFVCSGEEERAEALELSVKRMSLIDPEGKCSLLIRAKNIVFYSTLKDKQRASRPFYDVLSGL